MVESVNSYQGEKEPKKKKKKRAQTEIYIESWSKLILDVNYI